MSSILNDVKKALMIQADYTHFDPDLIMHINSVFSILFQLGVGPTEHAFSIQDSSAEWSDFTTEPNVEMVKTYVYMKVRLIFDPPTIGSVMDAYKNQIAELEWRLNVAVDPPEEEEE